MEILKNAAVYLHVLIFLHNIAPEITTTVKINSRATILYRRLTQETTLTDKQMKKALFTLAAAVLCLCAQAQNTSTDSLSQQVDSLQKVISQLSNKVGATEEADLDQQIWKDRAKFFSIGIGKQTLTDMDVDGVKWDSELAISMLWGRTYYFPKKAWFGMLKLGIDFAWMDMSYAKYKDFSETEMQPTGGTSDWGSGYPGYYEEDDDDLDLGVWQAEYAMRLGPSITINPVHHLKAGLYAHFVPTASAISMNDEVNVTFVPNFAFGGSIAWKMISVGFEGRWGKAKYNSFSVDDEGTDSWYDEGEGSLDDVVTSEKSRLKTKQFRFFLTFRF